MLVSVVLNILNERRNIRDLLDSLVIQEQPLELVVVDAGSTDGTQEIVRRYAERYPFVKLHIHPGTRGESTNYGVAQAKGELVAFIGGDCIANPFWIRELRRSLTDGATMVAGRTINIGYHAFEDLERVELFHQGVDISYPSCNIAYRREVLDRAVGFDPWFVTAEDIDLNYRAVSAGHRITYNDEMIIYHRTRGSFMGFLKQAFWNGYGRKQLTLKHGALWKSYHFSEMIVRRVTGWSLIRLATAMLGYLVCKAVERRPEPAHPGPALTEGEQPSASSSPGHL